MLEHRLPKRLTNYWDRIKNEAPLPPIEAFIPQSVPDLWHNCIKLSRTVEDGKSAYKYDFVGRELEAIFGAKLGGLKVKAKVGFLPAQKMMDQMEKSLKNPVPITIEGQFVDSDGHLVKYRACLLPFGEHTEKITHFIIGVSWKIF